MTFDPFAFRGPKSRERLADELLLLALEFRERGLSALDMAPIVGMSARCLAAELAAIDTETEQA